MPSLDNTALCIEALDALESLLEAAIDTAHATESEFGGNYVHSKPIESAQKLLAKVGRVVLVQGESGFYSFKTITEAQDFIKKCTPGAGY